MLRRIGTRLEKLAADRPVLLAFFVFVAATLIVIPISLPYYIIETDEIWLNILAEMHGTLFDLLIIGWFLLWLRVRAETRLNNNRYREEIDDYLGWKSPEATHRIAGNIRRLNRGGVKENLRLTHAFLKGANLSGASLKNSDLWGADLEGANLGAANLQNANLAGANMEGAELENATFAGADLRGAIFAGADLERVVLVGADLRGAVLAGADLQYANLKEANLERADLSDANLREANLEGARLQRASLKGTRLRGANLRGADLRGTDLEDADLERALLVGAQLADGEEFVTAIGKARSLFRAQFDAEVEERMRKIHPDLFEWKRDSDIF